MLTRLVRRDFSTETGGKGQVVNIPKRGAVTVRNKAEGTGITSDAPTNTTVPVTLDLHKYVSWKIEDNAGSKAIDAGLRYLDDAIPALVEELEGLILAEYANAAVSVGVAGTPMDGDLVLDARKALNDAKVPMSGRVLVVSSADETHLLKEDKLVAANTRGDDGEAMREARIGRLYGFDVFMSQLVNTTIGPNANHNMAMHPDAVALVTRVLPAPPPNTGALSQVVTDPISGLAFRYTQSWSSTDLAMVHTVDLIAGIDTVEDAKMVEIIS
jgi:hypothetical protein